MTDGAAFFIGGRYNLEGTDEELVDKAVSGDTEALEYLLCKHKDLITMKINKYFIIGAEKEDIVQEGMIGLYKAIKAFDKEKQKSFKSFANMCVERQIITAIKNSTRQKHMALNTYLSLNDSAYENDDNTELIDILNTNVVEDPLETITKKEYYEFVGNKIEKTLSAFEKSVLERFMSGETYLEIATKLDSPVKSIDNAIQRIRKKTTREIEEE